MARKSQQTRIVTLHRTMGEIDSRRARASGETRNDMNTRSASTSSASGRDARAAASSRTATSARRAPSTREAKRRQRTKAKANKMFDRQFGDSAGSMSAATGASVRKSASAYASDNATPRAALYTGHMGANQKRAARMQASSSSSSLTALPSALAGAVVRQGAAHAVSHAASRAAERAALTTGTVKALTAVLCTVLVCVFLYTPLQQYYQSQREYAKLSAEYESIEGRNGALDVQNDILVSEAGMEDTVRQRFGYVKPGESMGVVLGLSENATDGLRGSEKIEANVLSSTVKAPEEWYTPFLDALFGVE